MTPAGYYIGLMSGTSLDGVDGVLVRCEPNLEVLAHASAPFAPSLRAELQALNSAGPNELHRAALAANALVETYARVVESLLQLAQLPRQAVRAIGAHGQTVRHQPGRYDGVGYTVQLNQPALLAERCGMDVVADFRSRDVAAGGQGAPLVPAFHQRVFGRPGERIAVLNVGGIANLSLLGPGDEIQGFDSGPGNLLLDHWCHRHTGHPYDEDGRWAGSGTLLPGLLERLLQEPFLKQAPPKSTGRELFNPDWLNQHLSGFENARAQDVQATLTAFSAQASLQALRKHAPGCRRLIVCGGGALNRHLMGLLRAGLPGVDVLDSGAEGLPPLQVEAAAFAWLARQALHREPGNWPAVTGARGLRVLGAIYLA